MTPYLYRVQNRHAPKRDNGLRFWGYPGRSQPVRLIGVHTTESIFDLVGQDLGAENVAAYQAATDRPSSYHRIVDRDSTVVCLPDEATAFGIGNLNSPTLHLAFAMRATDWLDPAKARAAQPMLERGALVAAEWVREHDLPLVRVTRARAFGNGRGFIPHGVADPTRRSDPGAGFPWPAFFALIRAQLTTRPAPAPTAPEDDMKLYIYTGADGMDWATDLLSRRRFQSQTDKGEWVALAKKHGHTVQRIELSPAEAAVLPAVGL